jgi:hypothetical protein
MIILPSQARDNHKETLKERRLRCRRTRRRNGGRCRQQALKQFGGLTPRQLRAMAHKQQQQLYSYSCYLAAGGTDKTAPSGCR